MLKFRMLKLCVEFSNVNIYLYNLDVLPYIQTPAKITFLVALEYSEYFGTKELYPVADGNWAPREQQ